ncbi:hypothetical protein UB31_27745 [Bradyrhizobium sp. LTSP849]|nr:hypothetical protein UB31_27745 [Bradyrhizobium sp. LTSP849]
MAVVYGLWFTRERSKVRSLVRPPFIFLNLDQLRIVIDALSAFENVRSKMSKTTPCTVAVASRINGLRLFRIPLLRRAKQGQDGIICGDRS